MSHLRYNQGLKLALNASDTDGVAECSRSVEGAFNTWTSTLVLGFNDFRMKLRKEDLSPLSRL